MYKPLKRLFLLLILTSGSNLFSQIFSPGITTQESVGARPMAMGETFAAIADDIDAIQWNPAGLTNMNHFGFNVMHANLFNSNIGHNYVAVAIPALTKTCFGVDWMNIGFNDHEFNFGKNKFNFSAGYQPFNWLSIGANLKYVQMNMALDHHSLGGPFYGWGADAGLLVRLNPKIKLGLVIQDLTNTRLNDIQGPVYRRNLRLGTAYQPFNDLLLGMDLDDRLHFGAEYCPFKLHLLSRLGFLLALRAGVQKDLYTREELTYSFGMGLELPLNEKVRLFDRIRLDYAYTDTPLLNNTHRVSLSFLLDLFPKLLKITHVEIEPIFPSLYKYHSTHPIGHLIVDYKGKENLNCEIRVKFNKYAEETTKSIFLLAGLDTAQSISLNTVLKDSVLREPDNIPLIADIKISYLSGNRPREERITQEFLLNQRNAIDWEAGPARAAAFVTHEDPAISNFTERALVHQPLEKEPCFSKDNFMIARCLFDAVSAYGVRYGLDRFTPGGSLNRPTIDQIRYPNQTLEDKRGDCDDLSVLFAALFENRDIPTAFVDYGNHIFILLNIDEKQLVVSRLPYPENYFIQFQDGCWLPLECTWLDSSFDAAWRQGVEEIAAKEHEIINIRDAWTTYQPVNYVSRFFEPLPAKSLSTQNTKSTKQDIKSRYLNGLEQQIAKNPNDLQLRNSLAIKYVNDHQYTKAKAHLLQILKRDPQSFTALNNLGNVAFLEGKTDSAESYYLKAEKFAKTLDQTDGLKLNLAYLADVDGDTNQVFQLYAEVMQTPDNAKRIYDLLKIKPEPDDTGRANPAPKVKRNVTRTRLEENVKKTRTKPQPKLPNQKQTRRTAGTRGRLPVDEIENIFYWVD